MRTTRLLAMSAAVLAAVTVSNAPARAADAPVALIISQGGLGDGSWNDTANAGFKAGLEAKGRPRVRRAG